MLIGSGLPEFPVFYVWRPLQYISSVPLCFVNPSLPHVKNHRSGRG